MKEYIIVNSDKYKIQLRIDENNLDYYTDIILELSIGKEKFVLLKDNIIYFFNTIDTHIKNIDDYNLDKRLDEKKLGLLFNEYYYCIYEDIISDNIILDDQNRWIGEKYCCFSNSEYTTWLYKNNDNIVIKVTPMFKYFDEENNHTQYLKFVEEYADVFNTAVTFQQLIKFSEILSSLRGKL